MVLAEIEVVHSRPIAPTRRVALGKANLPIEAKPAFGSVLLGAVMAAHVAEVAPELQIELAELMRDVEAGRRIAQPRVRHRFQTDHVGLHRSVHRLVRRGNDLAVELAPPHAPVAQVLGVVYAIGAMPASRRASVMATVRAAMRWRGEIGPGLLNYLAGGPTVWSGGAEGFGSALLGEDPVAWARSVLGTDSMGPEALRDDGGLSTVAVQRRFRQLLREAHPDHGGASELAALRISELREARRILLQ